jgi:hypothetical protein
LGWYFGIFWIYTFFQALEDSINSLVI